MNVVSMASATFFMMRMLELMKGEVNELKKLR